MNRGFDLRMGENHPLKDISFPDILKLGEDDRDYFNRDRYSGRRVKDSELPLLEIRSLWYKDLSIPSFDEIFMTEGRDSWGNRRRDPESLLTMGAPLVLHAMRTFTSDIDLLNFRLDVQEDFQAHPDLVAALNTFYSRVRQAGALWKSAYELDRDGNFMKDSYGRRKFKDWFNLPKSFLTLQSAVETFLSELETAATSDGLKSIHAFLKSVQQHSSWRHWKDVLENMSRGGKYCVAFEFDMNEGVSHKAELGLVPPGSELDRLLKMTPDADGVIARTDTDGSFIKHFSGLVSSDIGYVLESSLNLDFDGVPGFCDLLTRSLAQQFSFYATLGRVYTKYEELGMRVCRPELGKGKGIEIRESIHPVVAWQAREKGEDLVFNDFAADDDFNFFQVTGPNDGGKSCWGKDTAFTIVSCQAGMMGPAASVRIGDMRREVFTNFVQQDDIEKGMGRHLNELQRSRRILEVVSPEDFVLLDEPNGGTDAASGFVDSCNMTDFLAETGAMVVQISHLHEVAAEVENGRWEGVANMQAEIVDDTLTHRIIPGRAGQSYGSRISRQARMSAEDLQDLLKVRRAMGELPRTRTKNRSTPGEG